MIGPIHIPPSLLVEYHFAYDAASIPFRFPRDALLGLLPLLGGILIMRFPTAWFEARPAFGRIFGTLVAGFGLLILLGIPLIVYRSEAALRDALTRHTYTPVEGIVTDFTPGQPDGHPMERFTVAGHAYTYSPFTSPGFNRISTEGGPIRAGLRVRIADVQGNIARLEVAR